MVTLLHSGTARTYEAGERKTRRSWCDDVCTAAVRTGTNLVRSIPAARTCAHERKQASCPVCTAITEQVLQYRIRPTCTYSANMEQSDQTLADTDDDNMKREDQDFPKNAFSFGSYATVAKQQASKPHCIYVGWTKWIYIVHFVVLAGFLLQYSTLHIFRTEPPHKHCTVGITSLYISSRMLVKGVPQKSSHIRKGSISQPRTHWKMKSPFFEAVDEHLYANILVRDGFTLSFLSIDTTWLIWTPRRYGSHLTQLPHAGEYVWKWLFLTVITTQYKVGTCWKACSYPLTTH